MPRTILYDNTRIAVAQITGDGERRPPEAFSALRSHYLFAAKFGRLGKRGKREYVQVLRLMETFSLSDVAGAVRQALELRAIAFDAVKRLVLCALDRRPPRLDLKNCPHLPLAEVALTRAADYQALLGGGAL